MTSAITVTMTLFLYTVSFIVLETKLPKVGASPQDLVKVDDGVRKMQQGIGNTREKRAARLMIGGAAVIQGNRARRVILSGAKQVHSGNNNRRLFVKRGSYADALRDFYAARPTDIKQWKEMDLQNVWGVVKSGHIGDKTITVKSRGWDGKPVLEIIDYNVQGSWNDGHILVDSVEYMQVN